MILTLYACGVWLLLVFIMCVCTFVILTLYACGVDGVDGVGGVFGVAGIGGVDGVDKWVEWNGMVRYGLWVVLGCALE